MENWTQELVKKILKTNTYKLLVPFTFCKVEKDFLDPFLLKIFFTHLVIGCNF